MNKSPTVFLVDNGSLRPQAVFALRELATNLANLVGFRVEAVSLLHSHKIDPADLGGTPATIVRRRLKVCLATGERQFVILPLFLGPSSAIKDYLPELIEEARTQVPDLMVKVAEPLAGGDVDQPDPRLAEMLADHVRATIRAHDLDRPSVAVVDHGTPLAAVNQVRNAVAAKVADILEAEVSQVIASSMERRDGAEYDFNEPLLERLDSDLCGSRECIAAMFFLLPGRHAGEGGDVVEICDELVECGSFVRIFMTPLLGEHPMLLDILKDRLFATRG